MFGEDEPILTSIFLVQPPTSHVAVLEGTPHPPKKKNTWNPRIGGFLDVSNLLRKDIFQVPSLHKFLGKTPILTNIFRWVENTN